MKNRVRLSLEASPTLTVLRTMRDSIFVLSTEAITCFSADYRYEVHEIGERSARVTLVANCQITGLRWRVVSPLLRLAIRFSDGKQLRLLKAMVEGG